MAWIAIKIAVSVSRTTDWDVSGIHFGTATYGELAAIPAKVVLDLSLGFSLLFTLPRTHHLAFVRERQKQPFWMAF